MTRTGGSEALPGPARSRVNAECLPWLREIQGRSDLCAGLPGAAHSPIPLRHVVVLRLAVALARNRSALHDGAARRVRDIAAAQRRRRTMSGSIRVLVVDDFPVVVKGLAALIDDEPDLEVVGQAGTVAEAVEKAQHTHPDVAVVDYGLPDGTGIDAATGIKRRSPRTAVLFLSRFEEDAVRLAAFEAGAAGYLSKADAAENIVDSIRRAAQHETLIGTSGLADLLALQKRTGRRMDSLTARELEILKLMAKGSDNKRIATQLAISYATVRGHVRSIVSKLDAHSRLEAVANAAQLGLIERPFRGTR